MQPRTRTLALVIGLALLNVGGAVADQNPSPSPSVTASGKEWQAARDRQGLPARTGPVLGEQDDLPDVLGVVGELALDRLEDGVRLAADRDDP